MNSLVDSLVNRKNRRIALTLFGTSLAALPLLPIGAHAQITPEEEAKNLGKILKPIPDSEWSAIAQDRGSQEYSIVSGDTLYDISKRLFGDPKYWPKIWSLNNTSIGNPHIIRPGVLIAFYPGTGTSLPSVAIASSGRSEDEPAEMTEPEPPAKTGGWEETTSVVERSRAKAKRRSQEWKNLPPQTWEMHPTKLPDTVDKHGFDTRKMVFRRVNDFEMESIIASDAFEPVGEVTGALTDASEASLDNRVFIKSDSNLQIGETYALTGPPVILNRNGERKGFSYQYVAKVRIIGVQDAVYVGLVTNARAPISRKTFLIPLPPRAKLIEPIPGPSKMEATVFFDRRFSTDTVGQFHEVFINLGSEDGVQPGMVFRAFQTRDPSTRKEIAPEGMIMRADIMIVQSSPRFSAGYLLATPHMITEGTAVTLLTNVSDVGKPYKIRSGDDLEKLEPGGTLEENEARELKQLEQHGEELPPPPSDVPPPNPEEDTLPPPPTDEPTDADALPPSPDEMPAPSDETAPPPPSETPPADDTDLPPPPSTDFPEPEGAATPPPTEEPAFENPETAPPPPPPPAEDGIGSDFPPPP